MKLPEELRKAVQDALENTGQKQVRKGAMPLTPSCSFLKANQASACRKPGPQATFNQPECLPSKVTSSLELMVMTTFQALLL